jgi:hypothetical protein
MFVKMSDMRQLLYLQRQPGLKQRTFCQRRRLNAALVTINLVRTAHNQMNREPIKPPSRLVYQLPHSHHRQLLQTVPRQ